MADLETMLRESLESAAEGAPGAVGLAEAGRQRARRRRTTWAVGGAAAAVVAVSVGKAMVDRGPQAQPDPLQPLGPTRAADVPSGWRAESWHDVTFAVPDAWGYGALDQWCADDGDANTTPVVQRPDMAQTLVGCTPSLGLGAKVVAAADFAELTPGSLADRPAGEAWQVQGGRQFVAGAWVGYQRPEGSDSVVLVVAPDRATAARVLGSVSTLDGLDANGCASEAADMVAVTAPGDQPLSVCRYDADGRLAQSERLTIDDSEQALDALTSLPIVPPGSCTEEERLAPFGYVLVSGEGRRFRVVWESPCALERGVYEAGKHWALSSEVLYWAVSPGWSGGWSGDIPMPDAFRR